MRHVHLLLAVVGLLGAVPLPAQQVHLRGDDRTMAARLAREVLDRGTYVRIDRDTVLPASFRAPGDLVVVDADVRLEGEVAGSAVVLGGDLFLRPGARVGGSIAVVDGGVYPSSRATYGTIFESNPSTRIVIAPGADTLTAQLEAPPGPPFLTYGLRPLPTYDRVNGLTASAGLTLNLTRAEGGARLDLWGSYRAENDDHWGGGSRLDVPLGRGVRAIAEGARATRTNDAWARDDLANSVSSLVAGNDYRDYYDADRVSLTLSRPLARPLIAGDAWFGPRAGAQVEESRSLPQRAPWSLLGDLDRLNPAVVDGRITSVFAGAELHWAGRLSRVALDGQVEVGRLDAALLPEDTDFVQLVATGSYEATAFRTHLLRYRARVMLPLDGAGAPPQRFGLLGGIPTIPTLGIGEQRGDHLVFSEGSYTVPLAGLTLPLLGAPGVELRHVVGAAWTDAVQADWVQNVGVGLVFPMFAVRLAVDPADTGSSRVFFGLSAPAF